MWLSLLVSRESATGPSETVNGYRWRSKTAANAVGLCARPAVLVRRTGWDQARWRPGTDGEVKPQLTLSANARVKNSIQEARGVSLLETRSRIKPLNTLSKKNRVRKIRPMPAECPKRTSENPASGRDAGEEDEAGASKAVRSQAEPVNERD